MSELLSELPNGFRIVTDSMDGLASAAVGVWVQTGGRHESDDQTGLSHFLEHMAFKGTARRSAFEIADQIESVGGTLNAYTTAETTAYFARVLRDDVPLAVDILADILREPSFKETEIELERSVILQEIAQALDYPGDVVQDQLHEHAYPSQALGRSLLGPADLVSRFKGCDMRRYLQKQYRPEAMILAAAGAVDHQALLARAEALFGDLPPGGVPRAAIPARYEGGEFRQPKELEQAHLALALEMPGYQDPDRYAVGLFVAMLGGGITSRLFQEIRERRGLAYEISSGYPSFADSGLLEVHAGTQADNVELVVELVIDEIRGLQATASELELDRARAQMRAALAMSMESPMNRCERMAASLAAWGRVMPVAESLAELEAVDIARIGEVIGRWLQGAQLTAAYCGPVATAPSLADLNGRLLEAGNGVV